MVILNLYGVPFHAAIVIALRLHFLFKFILTLSRPIHLYLLIFEKSEKSSSTNWIFNLQKSISKLIFAGYTGSKNPVRNRLKIQFVELDFSKIKYR